MAVDGGARNLDDVEVAAMQASIGDARADTTSGRVAMPKAAHDLTTYESLTGFRPRATLTVWVGWMRMMRDDDSVETGWR